MVFLKQFLEEVNFEKIKTQARQITQHAKS